MLRLIVLAAALYYIMPVIESAARVMTHMAQTLSALGAGPMP